MSFLTAWRLGFLAVLILVFWLSGEGMAFPVVLLITMPLFILLWPGLPIWRGHFRELFADKERVRRETRRDFVYLAGVLVTFAVLRNVLT